eukprot:m.282379 g.282379  ORF g.282379 m.282379 type:complete len:832 (+) comp17748_c0_seq1:141-2636(+)
MPPRKRAARQPDYESDDDDDDYELEDEEEYNPAPRRKTGKSKAKSKASAKTSKRPNKEEDTAKADIGIGSLVGIPMNDDFGSVDMRRQVTLKKDHENRPIFITPNGHVFLETFSPIYRQAYDFLIAVSEPVCRPEHVHEYRITTYSLYAAASVGLRTESILKYLDRLCKTEVPIQIIKDVRACTERYGKVKLVLRNNKYFIETADEDAISDLLRNPVIREAKLDDSEVQRGTVLPEETSGTLVIAGIAATEAARQRQQGQLTADGELTDEAFLAAAEKAEEMAAVPRDILDLYDQTDELAEEDDQTLFTFEIKPDHVQKVQAECAPQKLDYPLLDEYDFRRDTNLDSLKIDLKPTCILRPYQEKALRKMFGSGQARSGIIVLPCGAGKTLTGVTAVCTIKKRAIVLCTSNIAVEQWRNEFRRWCDIDPNLIRRFTSEDKELPPENCIICCTYSMLAHKGNKSEEAERVINFLKTHEWGVMVLDEVQTVPAQEFRRLLTSIPSHCKLGLTATLVREDGKIEDLRFLVGPKLYEANWMDLQDDGHIARVQCCEVWCKMTPQFYSEYCKQDHPHRLKLQLCVCNPIKFMYCEFLIRKHEERGDKIIVFSDDVFALQTLAKRLDKEYIYGDVPTAQRHEILHRYKRDPSFRTIFFSKIADNAFDLPEANVLIQVSSHGGSRRQEAQRLGRILRKKKGAKAKPGEYNAFFYSLVSQDTKEMAYATGRQRFLIDQGYSYKVVTYLQGFEEESKARPFAFSSSLEQTQLLTRILANKLKADDLNIKAEREENDSQGRSRKQLTGLAALSGGADMVYTELSRKAVKPKKGILSKLRTGR